MKRLFYVCGVVLLTIYLFLNMTSVGEADRVRLKNGEVMEGIATEYEEGDVELDMGYGKVLINRNEIDSIEILDDTANSEMERDWREQHFTSYPAPRPEDQKLLNRYKSLANDRVHITNLVYRKKSVVRDILDLNERAEALNRKVDELSSMMKTTDMKSAPEAYNRLVYEVNDTQLEAKEIGRKITDLETEEDDITSDITSYITEVISFRDSLKKAESDLGDNAVEEVKRFFVSLEERTEDLTSDMLSSGVEYKADSSGLLVEVSINGRDPVTMVVDTGASFTVITAEVAASLGLMYDNMKRDVSVTVADGRVITAKFCLLQSVKVGNMEARAVESVILPNEAGLTQQCLLGMSYLNNFAFSIDPKSRKVYLYTIGD